MSRQATATPKRAGFLCKVRQAAWALGVDDRTMRRMCERAEVKATKVGSDWRINIAALCEQFGIDRAEFDAAITE